MPRSPSRDLSDRYLGNRGYFRRADRIARAKYFLAMIAAAMVLGWAAFDVMFPARAAYSHTHGPLANPHARFDSQCSACHRDGSGKFDPSTALNARERWHDLSCEKCHEGPAHSKHVTAEGAAFHERCSNCHHDHGGRMNSLTRISDDHCTRCHNDLAANHSSGTPALAGSIGNFASHHPEFGALKDKSSASRTLKFSHGLHMTPGMIYRKDSRGELTISRLKELAGSIAVERYRKPGQSDSSLVTLDCQSCHRLEGSTPNDGAYYQPIHFDNDCRTCHPLHAPTAVSGAVVIPAFDLPHRVQPRELQALLEAGYSRGLLDPRNPAMALPLGPGGRFDPRDSAVAATVRSEVNRMAEIGAKTLFDPSGTCAKCHDLKDSRIVGPVGKALWFERAKFNHAAHRGVSCAACHPGTGAAFQGEGWTSEKEPPRIAGIESCRQCHAPEGFAGNPGGARHSCTDCHNYHGKR